MAREKLEPRDPAFHALLAWLNPDRERASEEYVRLHRRFTKMFEARGCVSPEDCTDETFDRVGNQLVEGKEIRTQNPMVYLNGVARHVLQEQWSKPIQAAMETVPPHKLAHDESHESAARRKKENRHTCLEECLSKLPEETRVLVLEYYAEDKTLKIDTRSRMAKRLGIAAGVLRNRIFKLRGLLRDCIAGCLAASSEERSR